MAPRLRYLFSTEGPYATLDSGFRTFFPDPKKAEKKAAHWGKKGNVGIHLARVLLSTGDRYILEFDRGAGRAKRKGSKARWGGLVENDRVVGSNQMGALLMRVRETSRDTR